MSHKIFDNDLVVIRKIKLALKLNKAAYIGMSVLELSKYYCTNFIMISLNISMTTNLMYEFNV